MINDLVLVQNKQPIQQFIQQPPPQVTQMSVYSQIMPPHSQASQNQVSMANVQHPHHPSLMLQAGPPQVSIPQNQPQLGPAFVQVSQPSIHLTSPAIQPTSVPNPQFFSSGPPPQVPASVPPSTMIIQPPKEVISDVPYYELPAGLMVPLVKLEDFDYIPIDPKEIRLPPPAPPNERLLKAVEAFYAPPTHERPRNSEGWEQLGLYEFFKAKSQAKKIKEDTGMKSEDSETDESVDNYREEDIDRKHSNHSHQNYHRSRSPSPKRRYQENRRLD